MRVSDITAVLEQFAPLSIQESWDNSGLIIGDPEDEVHAVLLGFDCTPELVDEAVRVGADMIVTHHPVIFHGLKKLSSHDPVANAVVKAVKAGIAVYAAHTTADKVIAGVSGAMAKKLGLTEVEVLVKEADGIGLGAVGNLPIPIEASQAPAFVKGRFGLECLRCSKPFDGQIRRIAMCGGSGSDMIGDAMAAGAQLYLCGDLHYHHFFTPEGFMVMDVGHFESEVDIVDILFSLLRKNFPNFAVHISSNLLDSNPVLYC